MRTTICREKLRICAILPYPLGTVPGQRFRLEQWKKVIEEKGEIHLDLIPCMDEALMRRIYSKGNLAGKMSGLTKSLVRSTANVWQARKYDAAVIYRTVTLAGPALLERCLKAMRIPVIYDFDDAIFLTHTSETNRRFGWLKFPQKTADICRLSSHVVVGNEWLADYARQFNGQVTIIPTSIEIERYRTARKPGTDKNRQGNDRRIVVGWTGSSTSQTHLEMFAPVLHRLMARREVELRIISNREPELSVIPYVWRPWKPDTEVEEISRFDIGIMPMPDDQWSRGKCALKALQCMATGTPVVCSAVGANCEVIQHGENGLLALTPEEWLQNLELLIDNPALRQRLGRAGQQTVEDRYSTHHCAALFADVVRRTVERYSEER